MEKDMKEYLVNQELNGWMKRCRDFLDKEFYSKNDEGHRLEHMDDVFLGMLEVDNKLNLLLTKDMIFMVAYYHDIFTWLNRGEHNILAADYVLENSDKYTSLFEYHEKEIIANAIKEHRSSNGCKYSNNYSLSIQIADTGKPDIESHVIRSYLYNRSTVGHNKSVNNVLKHLKEKFGRKGYGFKCDFYRDYYKDDLELFWNKLDRFTIEDIDKIIIDKKIR